MKYFKYQPKWKKFCENAIPGFKSKNQFINNNSEINNA